MVKYLSMALRIIVIAIIYFVILKIGKIMYDDLRVVKKSNKSKVFALELVKCPPGIKQSPGSILPLTKNSTIGRSSNNTIVINDPYISSNHAKLTIDEGRLYIEDLGSTNNIYVNRKKIQGPQEIKKDDIIRIGKVTFKVIG